MTKLRRLRPAPLSLEAFAVDDSSVQLVWRGATAGPVDIDIDGTSTRCRTEPGSGGVVVADLAPGRPYRAHLSFADGDASGVSFRTLEALAGPVQAKVATVSDLHLGLRSFGVRRTIRDGTPGESAGTRCGRVALEEVAAWGPDLVVVKGDLTNSGRRIEWRQAAEVLADLGAPVVILPGNHETANRRTIEPWQAAAEFGLHVVNGVDWIDLPGLRVVLGTTVVIGRSRGHLGLDRHEQIVAAAADAPAAMVVLHHHLEHRPDPFLWPPGIPRRQADPFLTDLTRAQPASLVTSGHTHRHRRRTVGPVNVTQVGSTKDYPGVWAGYTSHEGGISQVVRRVTDPECLAWTEQTRRAMAGYWGHTAAGSIEDRCFAAPWERRNPEAP